RSFLSGDTLRLLAIAGPRTPALGPLLQIDNDEGGEVLLTGPDRDDWVVRYRTRAAMLRLDQPDLRLRGALDRVTVGDTLRIAASRRDDGFCLRVNQSQACRLGFTMGNGWALLLYPHHLPPWAQQLLNVGWVAGLVAPFGFW